MRRAALAGVSVARYAARVHVTAITPKKGQRVHALAWDTEPMDVTGQRAIPGENDTGFSAPRDDTMATLLETSAAVAASLDLDALLDKILDAIGRLVPSERASVVLDVPGRAVLRIACVRGEPGYAERLFGQERPIEGSLTGSVYRNGTALRVDDLLDPQWRGEIYIPKDHPDYHAAHRSGLFVPLVADRVVGTIFLARRGTHAFSAKDLETLQLFAPQVATAVTNARRYAAAQEQADGLQALLRASERFTAFAQHVPATPEDNPIGEIARVIAEAAQQIVPNSRTTLWRLSAETGRLDCLVYLREGRLERTHSSLAVGEGITGLAVQRREPIMVNDSQNDPRSVYFFSEDPATLHEHIMAVPLVVAGRATGALTLIRRDMAPYTLDEFARAQLLARQAAAGMERVLFIARLQEQNHALAMANRHKSAFLANISHELRTPLNAIIGFAQLLMDGTPMEAEERAMAYQDIFESGRHLLAMVNNILDVARIEAGHQTLARTAFPLAPEAAAVERMVAPLIASKGQSLAIAIPDDLPHVIADPDRLRQVLLNLLANAQKFTPEAGAIALRAHRAGPGRVAIAVADTGIGIAPEHQAIVFEAFQQVEQGYARAQQGTGLGLALTKQLVELMGGTIALESAVGVGSTFTITLPARVTP